MINEENKIVTNGLAKIFLKNILMLRNLLTNKKNIIGKSVAKIMLSNSKKFGAILRIIIKIKIGDNCINARIIIFNMDPYS